MNTSAKDASVVQEDRSMGVRLYLDTLYEMMRSPSGFYRRVAEEPGLGKAMGFLALSALFNATLTGAMLGGGMVKIGTVALANNLFMPALAAVFTFLALVLVAVPSVEFKRVMAVHAYASGLVLTASWIPGLGMALEPVRAVLVCVGLVRCFKTGWLRAGLAVVLTAVSLLVFFWSLAPVVISIAGTA